MENAVVLAAKTDIGSQGLRAMQCLSARDMVGLRGLFAAEIVLEWPFAGRDVATHQGVEAALKALGPLAIFETFVLTITDLYEQPEAGIVIMEGQSRGSFGDGRPDYLNRYVFILTITDGLVTRWREYFNPLEGARVFGKSEERVRPAK